MDPKQYPISDPSILLLNEIDILLAQTRLMELYLKQAQATAANDAARIHQEHQAELARLRADLAEQDQSQAKQAELALQQQKLAAHIDALEGQLNDKERSLAQRASELETARSEIARLHGEMSALATASERAQAAVLEGERHRQHLQTELAALRQQIEQSRHDFEHRQRDAAQLERELREQLADLQAQLTDSQIRSRDAAVELNQAQAEIAELSDRLAALQASRQQAESDAAAELEQSRTRLEAEISQLRDALSARDQTVHEHARALAQLEINLGGEITRLRGELEHKQQQLAIRDGEWQQTANELAELRQRMADFAQAQQQALTEKAEFDRARQALENEIGELHHAIARKEDELTQRYEALSAVELALHGRIQALQQELARSQSELAGRDGDLEQARADIAALTGQIETLERARAEAESAGKRGSAEIRQQFEAEISRLGDSLAEKQAALREAEERESELRGQMAELQIRLTDAQTHSSNAAGELNQARAEIAELHDRLAAQHTSRQQTEADAAAELKQSQARQEAEIAQLQGQLEQQSNDAELSRNQFHRAQEEIAALRERQSALEQARREAEENWQRAGYIQSELQARLKTKSDELKGAQNDLGELRQQLDEQVNELRLQLVQHQLLADSRSTEISELKTQLNQLAEQIADAEATRHPSTDWQQEFEQNRLAHERELAGVHADYQTRLQNLEGALAEARQQVDHTRSENRQLAERTNQLERDLIERSQTLAATKAESTALHGRVDELTGAQESSQVQAQAIEKARVQLDSELATLRQELAQKDRELLEQHGLAQTQKNTLLELENRFREQNQLVANQSLDLQTAQAQTAALNQRVLDLEQAQHAATKKIEQVQQDYEARSADLHADLAAKTAAFEQSRIERADLERSLRQELQQAHWALAQQQASAEALAVAQREKVQEIEARASQQQRGNQLRDDELEKSEARVRALIRRVEELEVELRHAEVTVLSRAEQIRQDNAAQLATLNSALERASAELAEGKSAQASSEQYLRDEIDRLVREVAERNQLLQDRNDELMRAKAQLDQLQDHFKDSASAAARTEHAAGSDVERIRADYQGQLALLQTGLSEKERLLSEHLARTGELEQRHRQEIAMLRRQLSEQPSAAQQSVKETTANTMQTEPVASLQSQTTAVPNDPLSLDSDWEPRPWRSRFVAKRRWKV